MEEANVVRWKVSDRYGRRIWSWRSNRQGACQPWRQLVVSDINRGAAERVSEEISSFGKAVPFVADTSKAEDSKRTVDFALSTFGKLHYAVNNAGIGGKQAPAGEVDIDDWDRVIGINLNGVMYGMRYQIPAMLAAGGAQSAIVNMASIHGAVAAVGNGAYTAAKHGVVGLTKNAAAEYGPQGLRINCVGPAYIDTPLLAGLPDAFRELLVGRHPLGRLGRPEEVARWSDSCFRKMLPSLPGATTSSTAATLPSSGAQPRSSLVTPPEVELVFDNARINIAKTPVVRHSASSG